MALAEAIPGRYHIPIAQFWTVFVPFCIIFAPLWHQFGPAGQFLLNVETIQKVIIRRIFFIFSSWS